MIRSVAYREIAVGTVNFISVHLLLTINLKAYDPEFCDEARRLSFKATIIYLVNFVVLWTE